MSDILSLEPIPPGVELSRVLVVAGTPPVYRMRVQLQDDTMIRGHTYGVTRTANPNPGVTVLQVRHALAELYHNVRIGAPWFPLRLLPQLVTAVVLLSQRLGQYPPGGTTTSGMIERRTFSDRGIQYRVDIENLFGHNLRA
jgi:hypothetical protein